MTTAILTAYNRDAQKFIRKGCTTTRDKLIARLENTVEAAGQSFAQLFPYKTKRKDVLNHIMLLLSVGGICKVEAAKLAANVGCSVRTVSDAVKRLKETGEILVAGLADGKNKYIFVLKSHENFQRILQEVFFIDGLPENEAVAEQNAEQIAEQENAESVGAVGVEDDFSGSKSFRSLSSKQERYIIQQFIENEAPAAVKTPEQIAKYISTYYTNDFQREFYDYVTTESNGFHDSIKDSALVLGLRLGSNCSNYQCVKAIQVAFKIDGFIKQGGTVKEGIPALFTMMYKHGLKMDEYAREHNLKMQQQAATKPAVKPVPLYNWLEERD